MLEALSALAAIECVVLLLLVSRFSTLSRAAGSCVGIFVIGKGRALSRLIIGYLSIAFATAVFRMRTASLVDLHYQRALAALTGSSLFVAIVIRQIHRIVCQDEPLRETLRLLKLQLKTSENEKFQLKQKQVEFDHLEHLVSDLRARMERMNLDSAAKDGTINDLRAKLENMKIDAEGRTKELRAAEASVQALKKQGEGFLLEYDRLLEDNGHLRNQLAYFDRKYSGSDTKKKS
ncbi:hypothetical protein SELMODRAFT_229134 [Selaginella moellendorffii]|uniref:Endoplasmic reticulum transmembrane protein n=1 Tax=Selaginella moellendorffii TaxID=88036 RepID=D8SQM4_SELML|nr:B-cell receptor-associated protein 31 [Selaginella moellendorffii]EFJ13289.1 hypothetical protein SELMODRAFT_229134 [Selaginella moellendorffii]|eukprot:XP_002985711.1 B-cell receptor-associated protein 31 [Selaginella moellendorffii]